jgi:hypothetical protein
VTGRQTAAEQLRFIGEAWTPLRDAVGARGDCGMGDRASSRWSVKELVAHLAFWEETVVPMLGFFLGRPQMNDADWYGGDDLAVAPGAAWPSTEVHNAREAAWAQQRSLEEVVGRWDRAHELLVALVGSLTDTELSNAAVVDRIAAETYRHYPQHLREVREGVSEK